MKKISCVFLVCILLIALASCGTSPAADQKTEEPAGTGSQPVSYSVYIPNGNADGFDTETVSAEEISAENILAELKSRNVLPEAVAINSFSVDNGLIAVDFNRAFADALCSMGTSGELMIIGSVVNTFVEAFQAESVYFTVDGQMLESGHTIYDFPISFVAVDAQSAG